MCTGLCPQLIIHVYTCTCRCSYIHAHVNNWILSTEYAFPSGTHHGSYHAQCDSRIKTYDRRFVVVAEYVDKVSYRQHACVTTNTRNIISHHYMYVVYR